MLNSNTTTKYLNEDDLLFRAIDYPSLCQKYHIIVILLFLCEFLISLRFTLTLINYCRTPRQYFSTFAIHLNLLRSSWNSEIQEYYSRHTRAGTQESVMFQSRFKCVIYAKLIEGAHLVSLYYHMELSPILYAACDCRNSN